MVAHVVPRERRVGGPRSGDRSQAYRRLPPAAPAVRAPVRPPVRARSCLPSIGRQLRFAPQRVRATWLAPVDSPQPWATRRMPLTQPRPCRRWFGQVARAPWTDAVLRTLRAKQGPHDPPHRMVVAEIVRGSVCLRSHRGHATCGGRPASRLGAPLWLRVGGDGRATSCASGRGSRSNAVVACSGGAMRGGGAHTSHGECWPGRKGHSLARRPKNDGSTAMG